MQITNFKTRENMGNNSKRCCICGKEFEGYGYNPYPVRKDGLCCRTCNYNVILPERFRRMEEERKEESDE